MAKKSYAEVALEIYESVKQSNNKERKLYSSTFWQQFRVKKRTPQIVDRVGRILTEQQLNISVKSGEVFGKEGKNDWIVLTLRPPGWPPSGREEKPIDPPAAPPIEWFNEMKTKKFESEKEVEYYFVLPLIEKLGYVYDDIAIAYPVKMFDGVRTVTKQADAVLFNGSNRENDDVLLVIEAKDSEKGITVDNIGQAKSYAKELLPAFYVITNGEQVIVYQFNGMLYQDKRIMDFDRSLLEEMWTDIYNYLSKKAAIDRKEWLKGILENHPH